MNTFTIHTSETATPAANAMLADVRSTLGFVPNVLGVIANSPLALQAFIEMNGRFAESSFNATDREIIQIATSVENECGYCVAGHSAFARTQGVPGEVIDALRDSRAIDDDTREALKRFTRALVRGRGSVPTEEVQRFLDAGYTPLQVFEVILGVCQDLQQSRQQSHRHTA